MRWSFSRRGHIAGRHRRELKMCELGGAQRLINSTGSGFAEAGKRPFHLEGSLAIVYWLTQRLCGLLRGETPAKRMFANKE